MKAALLAVALLATCTAANAVELAKWKHGDTTQVLTDERGACIEGASVIRVDGPTPRDGCYTLDENFVHIVWSDATSEKLAIRKFRPTRETVVAAEKERMDRDEEIVKNGMDAMHAKNNPPPPKPARSARPTYPATGK